MATTSTNGNPWFASTVGLAGLIVGYVIATGINGLGGTHFAGALNDGQQPAQVAAAGQQASTAPTAPAAPTPSANPPAATGPSIGKADAPVTVVEFTDFQCPFCQRHFQETFGQIKQNYVDTGKVKYVIRYFPLSFHANAEKAAETAACADDQGKFWDMHEKLFTTQNDWQGLGATDAAAKFKEYAKDLGLNTATFATCFDSGSKQAMIQKDESDGSASGVDGTPGFWILGPNNQHQMISGAYPYATFQSAIDGMLK